MQFMKVLFAVIALSSLSTVSWSQSAFTRQFALSESMRLTEEQRYADGVAMADKMKTLDPSAPFNLETHGMVALQVGSIEVASADFRYVLANYPEDPIALYGSALTRMLAGRDESALGFLNRIDVQNLPKGVQNEVAIARACCLAELNRPSEALTTLDGVDDPAAVEITALIKFREDGSDTDLLRNTISLAEVNGVPEVVEPPGLRLLLPMNDAGPTIEPSVIDVETQANLTSRFNTSTRPGSIATVTGSISVSPPRAMPPGTNSVALAVDSAALGVTNSLPCSFTWDTRSVSNGEHSLTFTFDNSNGNQIGIQVVYLSVINDADPGDDSAPIPLELTQRLWNDLRLNPDYKVPEYELAMAYLKVHDAEGYETHLLRAAALDPDYRDVRVRIHPLFLGQVPSTFPVPDGTTLPSSLGLSAGSASDEGFWAGSPKVREMALTYDDGPIPGPNAQLLSALRAVNAHATFFVVGMRAAESPDSLRQMAADGNAVEDHTFTHPNLTQILPQHILQEILRTAVIIQATTGLWPHFLRPPGGNTNTLVLQTARACGMSGAFWTIDALPAEESGSPDGVVKWVISRARPGAIVLMHNGMAATIAAVPKLVEGLRQRRYKLVTIRQLAADALAGRSSGT